MSFLSLNVPELRERWMKLYLNLMMLKSKKPKITAFLENSKQKIAEANEYFMQFFDDLEKILGE